MATWGTLMKRAVRRYGLMVDQEDDLLVDQLFMDRLNEIMREFALMSGGWRETFDVNLSNSTPIHAVSARVVNVIENTVRMDYDGSGEYDYRLPFADEQELRANYGILEQWDAGTPRCYYLRRGVTAAAGVLNIVLFPQSDTAVTSGLRFDAEVTPSEVTAATTVLPIQESEEPYLIAGICLALAETELSRGAGNAAAKIQLWEQRWEDAKKNYADVVEDSLRAGYRRVHYVADGYEGDYC